VYFYEELAKELPIKSAQTYATFLDRATGTHCIVMEDCMAMPGEPWQSGHFYTPLYT